MRKTNFALNLRPSNLIQKDQKPNPRSRFRSRGRLDQVEYRNQSVERESQQNPGLSLTESENRQLMLRLEDLARIEGLRRDNMRIKIPAATQALIDSKASENEVLKHDGSVSLSADWDIGDNRKIMSDEIRARNSDGLRLYDKGGSGIFISDGGSVGIGTIIPSSRVDILDSSNPQLRLAYTAGSIYTELQTDSNGHLNIDPSGGELNLDAIIDYTATMGNSSKDPTSDAPDDWLEIKIGGIQRFVPCYAM